VASGFATGATDLDPALVLTATVAGAAYGYSLLWAVILCVPFLLSVFAVSARIGQETRSGLVDLLRSHYGKTAALSCASLVIVINMAMIIADLMAVAEGLGILLDQKRILFVAAAAFSVWFILIFHNYNKVTRVVVWLSLPLFAYVASAALAAPPVKQILLHTFVPHVARDPGYAMTLVALLGSLLTPYVIIWQTSSRREPTVTVMEPHSAAHRAGTFITTLISYSVIVAAASALNPASVPLGVGRASSISFRQAALALRPVGELGTILFALGIIGAGLVALPVLVASVCYATAEAMGWKSGLSETLWEAKRFYGLISAALFVAGAANFFLVNPVKALYWSQVLAGILCTPILLSILLLSNDRRVMRTTNTASQNFWIGAAAGGLAAASLLLLWWKLFS
jgi:Mn2+/Fe2+ NRAMP family transporter